MSDNSLEPITIAIGDQTFRVRVTPEERDRFVRIAQAANQAVKDVLDSGVNGGPRALAMTIFQLSLELEETREALNAARAMRDERLRRLISRIDEAINPHSGVL
jgi:cell division protein ZapA (FtsZ GTPase activity inhibitor)